MTARTANTAVATPESISNQPIQAAKSSAMQSDSASRARLCVLGIQNRGKSSRPTDGRPVQNSASDSKQWLCLVSLDRLASRRSGAGE